MPRYPATTLKISAPSTAAPGSSITVTVSGLAPGEKFTISISGKVLLAATAPRLALPKRKVDLGSTPTGSHTLVATGQSANRTGSKPLSIVAVPRVSTRTKRI